MQWRHLRNSTLFIVTCVVAVSGMALPAAAITTVQSQVCDDFVAPVIVSPSTGTQTKDDAIMIEGTGEPGKTVAVMRDNTTQAVSAIAADGSFGFTVSLQQGDNTFIARESNECSTVKDSSPVTIHADIPVPVTPPSEAEPPAAQPIVSQSVTPEVATSRQPFVPVPNSPGFQKPKIAQPSSGKTVYLDTLLVEGTAYPNSLVTLYVNNEAQAQVTSTKEGTFKIRVVLREGRNVLKIRSTLAGKTATSDEITVTYIKKLTSTLSRPLSANEVLAVVVTAGAAVAGGASVVTTLHWSIQRYGINFKGRK